MIPLSVIATMIIYFLAFIENLAQSARGTQVTEYSPAKNAVFAVVNFLLLFWLLWDFILSPRGVVWL